LALVRGGKGGNDRRGGKENTRSQKGGSVPMGEKEERAQGFLEILVIHTEKVHAPMGEESFSLAEGNKENEEVHQRPT